jgi:hypothetical protein
MADGDVAYGGDAIVLDACRALLDENNNNYALMSPMAIRESLWRSCSWRCR